MWVCVGVCLSAVNCLFSLKKVLQVRKICIPWKIKKACVVPEIVYDSSLAYIFQQRGGFVLDIVNTTVYMYKTIDFRMHLKILDEETV